MLNSNHVQRINKYALFAWLAMFSNILNWRLRDIVAGAGFDFWDFYRIGLALLAALIAMSEILKNSEKVTRVISAPLVLLFVYGFVALISSQLVTSGVSFYSMWKAIEVLTVTTAALGLLVNNNTTIDKAYEYIVKILMVMLLAYVVEAIVFPSEAFIKSRGIIPYLMTGVMPIAQQNGLAFYAAVVSLFCVTQLYLKLRTFYKVFLVLMLLVSMGELILSQSRTSFIGLVVAIVVFLYFNKNKMHLILVGVLGFIMLIVMGFSGLLVDFLLRGQEDELVMSLSGRTEGWSKAWELFKESPVIGYGFVAAARTEILGNMHTGGMSTLHGAFFDVIVGVGMAGLIPWLSAIILVSLRMLKYSRTKLIKTDILSRQKYASMMALLALLLVRTTTSSGLAIHDHTYMLFLCVLMYSATFSSRQNVSTVPLSLPEDDDKSSFFKRNNPRMLNLKDENTSGS